jgi:hypothetical protein
MPSKTRWKGTVYIATVKSALDEIFPVAMALSSENENYNGWKHFLEDLKEAVPMLSQPHYLPCVTYNTFVFVSDREK